MADVGSLGVAVRAAVGKAIGDANAWIDAYASKDGWSRLDQAQRRLEAWVANLDDEPEERPLGVVRGLYEDACRAMADGFTRALVAAKWIVSASLHQTRIYSEVVSVQPKPVAYFFVDAMRFEMGVELAERLPKSAEVSVRPAVCALPSITPIGMAALLPGASSSFSVVEQAGTLGVRIDDAFLPDLAARRKFAASRVPKLADIALDELLSLQPLKLGKKRGGAGRHRALPGDRPCRRARVHVPGSPSNGYRNRQSGQGYPQTCRGRRRALRADGRPRAPVLPVGS
jgi:hypothetical protein